MIANRRLRNGEVAVAGENQDREPEDLAWGYLRGVSVAMACGYGSVMLVAAVIAGRCWWDDCIVAVSVMMLSIVALRHPLPSTVIQSLSWIGINVIPSLSGVSFVVFPALAVSLMMVSFRYVLSGVAMAVLQSVTVVVTHAVFGLSGMSPSPLMDMIIVIIFPVASCVGIGMQWRVRSMRVREMSRELDRQKGINAERHRREMIASTLHDQVTNRLAYQILRMRHDIQALESRTFCMEQCQVEFAGLLAISQELLEKVRATIDVLDSEPVDVDRCHESMQTLDSWCSSDPVAEREAMDDHVDQVKEEMGELGFVVETRVVGRVPFGCNPVVLDLAHAGIDEFVSNAIKYAESSTQYVLTVEIKGDGITVTSRNAVADDVHQESSPGMTGGRGLTRLSDKAKAVGGTLSQGKVGTQWLSCLSVPW